MAKQQRLVDRTRSRPLSIEFLRELGVLEDFTPPSGAFDPAGAWTHAYHLWLVQPHFGGGALTIRREPSEGGARLHVAYDVAEYTGYIRRTKAVLDCRADALATPTSWTLDSQILDTEDKPTTGTTCSGKGSLAEGVLEVRFAGRARKRRVPTPVTSQWSLFDAVQRLPGKATKPRTFTMLEEMDLVKPDQRLAFREERELEVGDATLRLCGYDHIGWGILPWQYWVDRQGRLLVALSGVRAFIYNTSADGWMRKKLDAARSRMRRRRQQR